MNVRPVGTSAYKYLEAVHRKPGISTNEIAKQFDVTRDSVNKALHPLTSCGVVRMERKGRNAPGRWFIGPAPVTQRAALTIRAKAVTLDPSAPAIVPAGVKVTVAPRPVDRFAVSVPPGWSGQITRDWRERRLGAMG